MTLFPLVPAEQLLPALLDLSVSGVVGYAPVLDATGQVVDFSFAYLNPAAQRLLGLPAQPAVTYRQQFTELKAGFEFHRAAYLAGGEPCHLAANYHQPGAYDAYFRLAAQRVGELLLVSFTTSAEQERQEVEQALRASQARERAAQAAVETERQRLADFLLQAPAIIVAFEGPAHTYVLANANYQALVGERPLLGRPLREAVPEIAQQPQLLAQLDHVYQTGETYYGQEIETQSDRTNSGALTTTYFNLVHQATRDAQGHISGVITFAYDVTAQVLARRQVEQLNQELETRVQQRTQALAEQRRQLRQILAQVPAAIASLEGPEHRFAFTNDIYRTLVGNRATLGQPSAEAQPELVAQGFIDLLDRVYTTGEPYLGREIPVRLLDAATQQTQTLYVDFSYQPLRDEQGGITGILTFAVDETEKVLARRQADTLQAALLTVAQRQAQEREDLFQTFEQAPAAIMLLREPEHRIEYANPAYQRFFPGQALQGHRLADAHPNAEASGALARLDRVYQSGETFVGREEPVLLTLEEGQPPQTRYFNFTYQPYRENDQTVGVSVFATDATEQALARQQREAQQSELRRIFEQAPVAIAIMRGPSLVVELANQAVAAIWGRSSAQTLGRPYFEAVPDTAGQGFEEILAGVLRTGEPFFVREAPVTLDRGHTDLPTQAYVNFGFHPLYDEHGATWGLIAVGTEVTEQVLARQQVQELNKELAGLNHTLQLTNTELNQSNTQLTRTNVDLDTFVYTASHDLKAPITNIEGLLTALHDVLPAQVQSEETTAHILRLLQGAVERFQLTIEQLTDISRLQQAQNLPAEQVHLGPVVADVRLDLLPQLTAAGAQLTVDISPDSQVLFAPKNLRSVVYNLLSNAIKYRAPDRVPVIALRATRAPGAVVLTVQDNGLGLSEAQQRQLFGLFQRLHTHVEGTGVGLYMVKRIVENAGGTITVQSREGVGATFTVRLPLSSVSP
ncbi:PAS domain-containing protein [Hymenobacter sp. HMF4947]|uniref:histidine kinase n=1 Tax=Hymenobacter ginkgonis TaxID=2682976 RepID=A0A7K1TK79_9BACT|nr:PAS domain-containing protein [Hymenobacter ginkgonis]MVN78809.1 PAS domain-containing protein [Hymenobacter ginkgonis]